jgi:hypothetical protein
MKKALMIISVVLGIALLYVAYVYWTTPANALPSFFPGFDPTLASVHFKHGLAAFIVALALFVFAWFQGGPKKLSQ